MTLTPRTISLVSILCGAVSLLFACGDEGDVVPLNNEEDGSNMGDGDGVVAASCESDKDCRELGGLCDLARQVCAASCQNSLECSADEVCDTGKGHCVECLGDNDCAEGVCQQARCVQVCTSDDDCGAAMSCGASGICEAASGDGDAMGGASGDGDGDSAGDGDASGDGDGDGDAGTACVPEVKILLQRSGAMFENPSFEDNWWGALSDALASGEDSIVSTYGDTLDLSVSTFHMTASSCPIINEATGDVGEFLSMEQTAHEDSEEKIDAPLPEAIQSAVSSFSRTDNRYLVIAVSGNPDSCDEQDGVCAIEPTVEALQAAAAAGIMTKVLYLSSSAPYGGYEQALANAGAGEDVAEMDGLGNSCGTEPSYFSESGGSAPYEAPESTDGVSASLRVLLDSIASCQ